MAPEWCTLTQRVVKLVREDQIKSQEFQFYLETFGRDKLESIWKEHLQKMRSSQPSEEKSEDEWILLSAFDLLTLDESLIQEYGGSMPDGSKYIRLRQKRSA